MSILTPSRGDILTVHNPHFGPLQPSAMPPPPASISPHPGGAFAVPPVLEKSRLDQLAKAPSYDHVSTWRKGVDDAPRPSSVSREALTIVNPNTTSIASTSTRSVSKPSTRVSITTSIPRPASIPDVFAPAETNRGQSSRSVLSNGSAKRAREPVNTSISKRVKTEAAEHLKRDHKQEEEIWRSKWLKMFPTLVFHFEIGTEQGSGKALVNRVMKMGAKVDQFFSTRVTHLIVKNNGSPQKPKATVPSLRKGETARGSPKNPFLDGTGVTDLIQKAEAMSIKVWNIDKLTSMLSRLAPHQNTTVAANDTLHTLLEDERIHGTRERDLTAPRPDYYYFKAGSKYLLIEDATNKHRPIMMKEYAHSQKDTPEWPTLFDGFLRPSASSQSLVPVDKLRQRAWALYVDHVPFEGENPPSGELRRSTSLRALPGTPKLPDALPYQNASGNSVVLTSNIASTSTANHSPAVFGQGFHDRTLMKINKRVQVLKGNARLAAVKRQNSDLDLTGLTNRRVSSGSYPPIPQKTFMTQDQLIQMLRQARAPVSEPQITVEMRIKNRDKVEAGLKGRDQDTAAGYCENCRLRYNDLSVHIASRKHRRFATAAENFASLDKLLCMLQRPPNPHLALSDFPPCYDEHEKDFPCETCEYVPSEPTSSQNSGAYSEECSEEEAATDELDEGSEVTDEE